MIHRRVTRMIYSRSMSTVHENNMQIGFTERISPGTRAALFVLGLLPWLAPYELLFKPRWEGVGTAMLFAVIISLGAIAISLAFIGCAIFGLDQTLIFDLKTKTVLHRYQNTVTSLRTKRYTFREIRQIETYIHEWESRPNTYSLRILFSDGRKTNVGGFSEQAEADQMRERLHNLIR
jgi:hypothetical protein